ncbi:MULTISPECIES: cysteine desulfurase family protein [Glycomyces]|uniref:Cysteine desulfurase n=2 Tax=Glycomyces TaxID=58113 RepID=A0A9X3PTK2_9ACTN|nr:cysteine desulfurase family protein [Glycomyces lechevalierae]MDA1385223.1 cysteine desulfurase family protein [Glycomyces lechevalierae]MDR7337161.1 cysteine desulfurase [Glycomyces lechevalierae]
MAYLDHAATTPMLPQALDAYVRTARALGNASSLHGSGRSARRTVEEARERIAEALGAKPGEVIFTGSGTEADNLAVKGVHWFRRTPERNRVVTTAIEHHAVADAVAWLGDHEKADVTELPVDKLGRVDTAVLAELLDERGAEVTVLTCMWANNEVGTLQPIAEIAALAAAHGIPVHTDAIQAVGHVPVDFAASGAAALALSGHKLGGPTGTGALILRRDVKAVPLLHGGGQEREIRSGTLDVPGIAALAEAVSHAVRTQETESRRLAALRDDLVARIRATVPEAVYNGDAESRLPGNAHFSFPGCEGDALLMLLDAAGVECATGSACSAGIAQPSHVLLAMGAEADDARSSLRFTLGWPTTQADVDALVTALPEAVRRAKTAGLS